MNAKNATSHIFKMRVAHFCVSSLWNEESQKVNQQPTGCGASHASHWCLGFTLLPGNKHKNVTSHPFMRIAHFLSFVTVQVTKIKN